MSVPLTIARGDSLFSSMVKQLTPRKRAEIRGMHRAGATTKELAAHFGRSERTMRNIVKTISERGSLDRKEGSGRPRKTTARQDKLIIRQVKKDRECTSIDIQRELGLEHVSDKTIRRRIAECSVLNSRGQGEG